jgi:hypothetical protein
MPFAPKCHSKINLCQSKPKSQVTQNSWLHLSSVKTDLKVALQHTLTTISMLYLAMTHLLTLVLADETMADADDVNYDALDTANNSIAIKLIAFLGLLQAVQIANGILFDIPLEQEDTPLQFLRVKGLRIDNLFNTAALKMTHFNWFQLCCLYASFDPKGLLKPMHDKPAFPTGHIVNGTPCCYRIHPEDVFLFTLCRLASGMLQVHIVDIYMCGDKTCWTYICVPVAVKVPQGEVCQYCRPSGPHVLCQQLPALQVHN